MKAKKSYTWIIWTAVAVFAVLLVVKYSGSILKSKSAESTPTATAEEAEQTEAAVVPETTVTPEIAAPAEASAGTIPGSSAEDVMASFAAVGAGSSTELKDGYLYTSDKTKINGENVQYNIETDQNGFIRCAQFIAYGDDKNGFLWAAAAMTYTDAQPDAAKEWVLENEGESVQTTIGNAVFVLSTDSSSRTLTVKAADYDEWSAQQ